MTRTRVTAPAAPVKTPTPPAAGTPVVETKAPEVPAAPALPEPIAAPVEAPVASVQTAGTPTTILVANQHTADIMMPRTAPGGVFLPPLILRAGTVTPVDGEEWTERRKVRAVSYYLDKRLLCEVRQDGPVPLLGSSSSNLVIPPHLSTEEHTGKEAPGTASVRRETGSEVTVSL